MDYTAEQDEERQVYAGEIPDEREMDADLKMSHTDAL